jgi:hypothetical protein
MTDNYNILIRKLDEFIRKYYKNMLIRGGIYFVTILFAFFICLNFIEYFAYFGTIVRTIMFYLYLVVNIVIFIKFVSFPLFKIYKLGKIISYETAAEIIGKHFSEIEDSLLNTLQLKALAGQNPDNNGLLEASINQKIKKLKPIPFTNAVNIKENRRYLKYALPPLVILLVLLFTAPSLITEPSKRLIHHNSYYEKEVPFSITVLNRKLTAVQQEDFQLDVKLGGEQIPDNLFIEINNSQYKLTKENNVLFHHTIKNIQKDTKFKIVADGYRSKEYEIKVLPKPMLLNFEIELKYPKYTNKKDEILENSGDIVVPYGTNINWSFNTKDTKKIKFRFSADQLIIEPKSSEKFIYSKAVFLTQTYSVVPVNDFMQNRDSLQYTITVVPDAYPDIEVSEFRDTVYQNHLYFKGLVKDDYGFAKLNFVYRVIKKEEKESKFETKIININNLSTQQQFFYYFDLTTVNIVPGDEVEYYFEIWDNDGINGSKSTRSQKLVYKLPSIQELEEKTEKTNDQIKDDLNDAIKQAQDIQKAIDDLDKKLNDKKSLSWQEKKQLQDLLDKQSDLQNKIEQIKQKNQQNNISEQQYKPVDQELLDKQQQLEKLFNELMTDEMKELFKQLQELMDKTDKDKVNEMLDKMKLSNEDMKKELDRNLELFKQLEFDKKFDETIKKLDELKEEQKKLSEETKNDNTDSKDLSKKQEELNKKFDDVRKDLDDLQKKNSELEQPNDMKKTDSKEEAIEQSMQNSKNSLDNNKKKKAAEGQKDAADKMQELSDELSEMQMEMEQEKAEEDINTLREILNNLVKISFDQEELMKNLKSINVNDPKYIQAMDKQKNLKDDMQMIEDSLFALSKRQPLIQSFVNKEVNSINDKQVQSLDALQNRNVGLATMYQQYIMTSENNLALLLSEALDQMQQQQKQNKMKSNKSCKGGKCKKPGDGKPSAKSMKEMQEQLNKKLEELKNQKDGKKPGKSQNGQSMSEQLARLAAQQEALRKMLQQYGEEIQKESGKKDGNIDKMLKDMEKTETDLVNKILNNETLKRQQEILTRLLESEKAEKQRELDEKRESNEGKIQNYSNPNQFLEYNKLKSKEAELLKTVPPSLKPYYKNKVNEYFYNF